MTMQKYTVLGAAIILSILAFIYINPSDHTDDITTSNVLTIAGLNGCTIQNNYCEFVFDQQKFEVTFPKGAEVEEESFITITSDNRLMIESISIEGINMYMGRSPVIQTEASETSFTGVFFLGSCNLAEMQWNIKIQLAKKTHPVEVRFTTTL